MWELKYDCGLVPRGEKSRAARKWAMNRRNFNLGFLAIPVLVTIALLVRGAFRHGVQAKSANTERQKRIDAARRDLQVITQAELRHIENQRKFAGIDELISSAELGPEMTGRNGYAYSVRLEGNGISASAAPASGENLPALVSDGPAIAPILGKLKKED
jgi:hypothetical protein